MKSTKDQDKNMNAAFAFLPHAQQSYPLRALHRVFGQPLPFTLQSSVQHDKHMIDPFATLPRAQKRHVPAGCLAQLAAASNGGSQGGLEG